MAQKPVSHRKTASCFINDQSGLNYMHVGSRTDVVNLQQRGPFTMNSSHLSKTNFMGESLMLPEGSRAFAITGSGEKRSIPLLEDDSQSQNNNTFILHSGNFMTMVPQNTNTTQSPSRHTQLSAASIKSRSSEKNTKLLKKSKRNRCHVTQKARLTFTPRSNADRVNSAHALCGESKTITQAAVTTTTTHPPRRINNLNAQTQTDADHMHTCLPSIASYACVPQVHSTPVLSLHGTQRNLSVSKIPPRQQSQLLLTSQQTHKKIYMTDAKLKYYSDLRGIASVLTFITVFSWLFSTFFELQFFSDLLAIIIQRFRSWKTTEELPKTKAELVVQFLVNLWS